MMSDVNNVPFFRVVIAVKKIRTSNSKMHSFDRRKVYFPLTKKRDENEKIRQHQFFLPFKVAVIRIPELYSPL